MPTKKRVLAKQKINKKKLDSAIEELVKDLSKKKGPKKQRANVSVIPKRLFNDSPWASEAIAYIEDERTRSPARSLFSTAPSVTGAPVGPMHAPPIVPPPIVPPLASTQAPTTSGGSVSKVQPLKAPAPAPATHPPLPTKPADQNALLGKHISGPDVERDYNVIADVIQSRMAGTGYNYLTKQDVKNDGSFGEHGELTMDIDQLRRGNIVVNDNHGTPIINTTASKELLALYLLPADKLSNFINVKRVAELVNKGKSAELTASEKKELTEYKTVIVPYGASLELAKSPPNKKTNKYRLINLFRTEVDEMKTIFKDPFHTAKTWIEILGVAKNIMDKDSFEKVKKRAGLKTVGDPSGDLSFKLVKNAIISYRQSGSLGFSDEETAEKGHQLAPDIPSTFKPKAPSPASPAFYTFGKPGRPYNYDDDEFKALQSWIPQQSTAELIEVAKNWGIDSIKSVAAAVDDFINNKATDNDVYTAIKKELIKKYESMKPKISAKKSKLAEALESSDTEDQPPIDKGAVEKAGIAYEKALASKSLKEIVKLYPDGEEAAMKQIRIAKPQIDALPKERQDEEWKAVKKKLIGDIGRQYRNDILSGKINI
jgi:hypothetical protein